MENTSQKNNNTHRNKNKKLNTTNLVSSIDFYHRKISLLFFFIPIKIRWKHVFLETMQSHWRLISSKRSFLTFGNLTVIKCKSPCESNRKSKKYGNFFEENNFSIQYRKRKIRLLQHNLEMIISNFVFKFVNWSSYKASCK